MSNRITNIKVRHPNYSRGSVLILVLIVLSSMIILSVGFAYRTQMEMQIAFNNSRRTQAYYLALGGIERIKVLFGQQEISAETIGRICPFIGNIQDENLFEQIEEFNSQDDKMLSYCLRDEQGLFNLNISDPACWINIDGINQDICTCILDWTDEDSDTGPGGAESDYYQRYKPPYIAKNGPIVTLKELLFIRGMERQLYTGEDLNRNNVLDDNERNGMLSLPFDNEDATLNNGMVDIFTVYGDGKLNLNTAPAFILNALPGIDNQVTELISRNRAGPDRLLGTDDDVCYASSEDIAGIKGLNDLHISLLQEYCCFESEYFRVFSTAGSDESIKCSLMATIKLEESEPEILYVERLL